KYPRVFNDLFVNMLAVGESGGVLDVVLQRLSGYIEKAAKLKSKVKGAMVYPVTIIGVAALVIIFMMIFVIPTFAKMFQGLGADGRQPRRRGHRDAGARGRHLGPHAVGAAEGEHRVSPDGRAHDQRGREHGRPRPDAPEDRRLLR